MATVTPAAWVQPAASHLAVANQTPHPTSRASLITMTTRPRTPPGSHPLCPPKAPPSPCQATAVPLVAPLATLPPPPPAPAWRTTPGWDSVTPGPTPLVVQRGSTASMAVVCHTSTTPTHPTTRLDCPRRPPLVSVSQRRPGSRTPTSTPIQPFLQQLMPWLQMEWLILGRESPWRPGKPAWSTAPQSA